MARLSEAPEHAVPAWMGDAPQKTIEKTTRTDKHAMQKRPVRLFLSVFTKRAPGLRQGMTVRHVSARWIHTVKTQSKNTKRNKKIKYSKKDANGGPFGLIPQKEATQQKPRRPGTKTAPCGPPAAACPVPGGARPGDAFHCVEHRFGVYYTLYWCGQQLEPGAAPHSRSRKRQRHGEQGKPSRKDGLYEDPAGE